MLQPLRQLFPSLKLPNTPWAESDQRHFIQTWLRAQLGTEQIYCEHVHSQIATIRVGSPTLYQAVILLEYDLNRALLAESQEELKALRVQL